MPYDVFLRITEWNVLFKEEESRRAYIISGTGRGGLREYFIDGKTTATEGWEYYWRAKKKTNENLTWTAEKKPKKYNTWEGGAI